MSFGCVICSDSFLSQTAPDEFFVAIKTCGHIFHQSCVTRWFLKSKTCPVCRGLADDTPNLLLRLHPQMVNSMDSSLFYDNPNVETEEQKREKSEKARMRNKMQSIQTYMEELKKIVRHVEVELEVREETVVDLTTSTLDANLVPVEPWPMMNVATGTSPARGLPSRRSGTVTRVGRALPSISRATASRMSEALQRAVDGPTTRRTTAARGRSAIQTAYSSRGTCGTSRH